MVNASLATRVGLLGFVGLSAILLFAHGAPVLANDGPSCDDIVNPPVIVRVEQGRKTFSTSKSVRQLSALSRKNGRRSPLGVVVSGLTVKEVSSSIQIPFSSLAIGNDVQCGWPERIEVTIKAQQDVYVAREFAVDTCWRNVVTRHEEQHVAINNSAFREMETAGKHALVLALDRYFTSQGGPKSIRSQRDSIELQNRIFAAMDKVLSDVDRRARQEHAIIDSPSNYRRLSSICKPTKVIERLLRSGRS